MYYGQGFDLHGLLNESLNHATTLSLLSHKRSARTGSVQSLLVARILRFTIPHYQGIKRSNEQGYLRDACVHASHHAAWRSAVPRWYQPSRQPNKNLFTEAHLFFSAALLRMRGVSIGSPGWPAGLGWMAVQCAHIGFKMSHAN